MVEMEEIQKKLKDALFDGREKVVDSCKSGMFPLEKLAKGKGCQDRLVIVAKGSDHFYLKILSPKQMHLYKLIHLKTC